MRSRFEARLQRLEQEAKCRYPFREDPEFDSDLCCLGSFEMRRACDALRAQIDGDEARAAEATSLLALAHTRRLEGRTQADSDALKKQDREKKQALWEFMKTLGPLSNGCYLDIGRFDVLDVTETEIKQLTEAAQKATCASALDAVAEIVGRLRLDGKVMEMAAFEALVLRREIAASSPHGHAADTRVNKGGCASLSLRRSSSIAPQDRLRSMRKGSSASQSPGLSRTHQGSGSPAQMQAISSSGASSIVKI